MQDREDPLRDWLSDNLDRLGPGATKRLAMALHIPVDAITRMKNQNPAKASRRIEAEMVPGMAGFFGEWPPGFGADIDDDRLEMVIEKFERHFAKGVPPKLKAACIAALYRYATVVDKAGDARHDHQAAGRRES